MKNPRPRNHFVLIEKEKVKHTWRFYTPQDAANFAAQRTQLGFKCTIYGYFEETDNEHFFSEACTFL